MATGRAVETGVVRPFGVLILLLFFLLVVAVAAGCAVLLIRISRGYLQRYALARPNARSSHTLPTPQGGGAAVVLATLLVSLAGALWLGLPLAPLVALSAATLVLAVVGGIDDIRPLGVFSRLGLQALCVAVVLVWALPGVRILPDLLPAGVERLLLLIGGLWFVNLVNFMDGLDWMSVSEIVPVATAAALIGWLAGMPEIALVACALMGGMLGFAPFNRPVAKLFLGDVGSLPIGLLTGFLLLALAGAGHLAAALILPLYYLTDATLTLFLRLARGEKVWQAHRSHFYQRATDNGFSVASVVGHVFALNLVLAGLAFQTLVWRDPAIQLGLVAVAGFAVAFVLARFAKSRPSEAVT